MGPSSGVSHETADIKSVQKVRGRRSSRRSSCALAPEHLVPAERLYCVSLDGSVVPVDQVHVVLVSFESVERLMGGKGACVLHHT